MAQGKGENNKGYAKGNAIIKRLKKVKANQIILKIKQIPF